MNKRKLIYIIINFIVLVIALFLLSKNFNITELINYKEISIIFICSVLFVHAIKALRLYIALYETEISKMEYLKIFCKVTPINIILPFKLGELFRIYCYGYIIKDWPKSTVIILLDRFMDTMALLTILALVLLKDGELTLFVYMLILFSLFVFLLYKNFPNLYTYWKKYFLTSKADSEKIKALKYMEILNNIYKEIAKIIQGRGIILYILSIFAWFIEIINFLWLIKINSFEKINNNISEYLFAALNLGQSKELSQFIVISIVILLTIYIIIKITELFNRKEVCK